MILKYFANLFIFILVFYLQQSTSWKNEADDLDLELSVGLDLEDLENASNLPSPQHQRKASSLLNKKNIKFFQTVN